MNKFHHNLKSLRQAKEIFQIDLAKEFHVTRGAIANWEKDRCPDIDTLIKMARFFDVSLDYLLGNVDEFGNLIPLEEESNT